MYYHLGTFYSITGVAGAAGGTSTTGGSSILGTNNVSVPSLLISSGAGGGGSGSGSNNGSATGGAVNIIAGALTVANPGGALDFPGNNGYIKFGPLISMGGSGGSSRTNVAPWTGKDGGAGAPGSGGGGGGTGNGSSGGIGGNGGKGGDGLVIITCW